MRGCPSKCKVQTSTTSEVRPESEFEEKTTETHLARRAGVYCHMTILLGRGLGRLQTLH